MLLVLLLSCRLVCLTPTPLERQVVIGCDSLLRQKSYLITAVLRRLAFGGAGSNFPLPCACPARGLVLCNEEGCVGGIFTMEIKRSPLFFAPCLVKFVPVVARLFCLSLPGSFLNMFAQNKGDLCIWDQPKLCSYCFLWIQLLPSSTVVHEVKIVQLHSIRPRTARG